MKGIKALSSFLWIMCLFMAFVMVLLPSLALAGWEGGRIKPQISAG